MSGGANPKWPPAAQGVRALSNPMMSKEIRIAGIAVPMVLTNRVEGFAQRAGFWSVLHSVMREQSRASIEARVD